jgi:Carboxypeptidase regulatory-like domain/TonB-dependent Receptor Plug Domain
MLLLAADANAQYQTLTGCIRDEASKAPITGAVIVVANTKPLRGGVSDAEGNFKIDSVPLGRQQIKVSYISYSDKILGNIEFTAGKQVNLNITMEENVQVLNEVAIKYNRAADKNKTINEMALISARSFNVDETKLYAGALGDPSRMAANFAGVVAGNDSRNDIVVRGNSPTGMLWQMEGINIPNPNHFGALNTTGGPVSMLNNNNIDKSDFFSGAFPAQYGNAMAGVFDIRLRDGNVNKPEYVAQVGFNGFELGAEGPIGSKHNASYLVNYRYSTLGVFKSLGINLGTGSSVPIYQDVNYKFSIKPGKKSKLSLFGIAGNSSVDFLGKDVDTTKPDLYSGSNPFLNQYAKYATTITGISYDYQYTEKTSLTAIASYATTYENYSSDSISNIDGLTYAKTAATFKTNKLSLKLALTHKFTAKDNLQAGVQYDNTGFNLYNSESVPGVPTLVHVNQTGSIGVYQSYVQWKHRFTNQLSMVTGLHELYMNMNNSFALEPRAGLKYSINSRSALALGYGIHNQEQSIYAYFVQTPTASGATYTNRALDFTRSNHYVASYDYSLTDNMRIKTEAYYQLLDRIPVTSFLSSYTALNEGISFAPPNQDSLVNKGTGYNYGLELTIEHFLQHGFYFLITTSFINSKYKGSDGVERNTAYNTGYIFNALAGKELKLNNKSSLIINGKVSLIGGRYLTPLNLVASAAKGESVYDDSKAFSLKQDDYFRADIKLSYKREFRSSTMEFSLDLENITNHKNIFNQTYDVRTNRMVNNYQQGFFPVPTFRWTF